jgi:hypothetical protein
MTKKSPFYASLRLKRTIFTRPKTCLPHEIAQRYLFGVISVAKNSCNLWLKICVNPWLINDLRSTKDYVRKNNLFMQNEPKFQKVKLNVNKVLTKNYDQMDTWSIRKNEPKTNPKRTQSKPIQTQFKPKTKPNKANFCTIGSAFCLQLPLNAENLLRNLVYGCQ